MSAVEDRQAREERWRQSMAAAQDGDAKRYESLLKELLPEIRSLVRRRLPDDAAVEDVVQNTLLAIHRSRHTYRSERPFGPWLRAVARNAFLDHVRARSRRGEREVSLDAVPEPADEPAPPVETLGLSSEVERALAELPAAQREAVELIQLRGLSVAEAAVKAGVSVSAVKVRAHRGYRALRTRLEGFRDGG